MSTDGEYSLPSPSQLHTACIEGDVKTLELFIHRHSPWLCHQLDSVDGWSPLILALRHGHVEIVAKLIEYGAHIDITWDGETPLHMASNEGDLEVVKLLLRSGANIHARNSTIATPLHVASSMGYRDVVELLLQEGAKVDDRKKGGYTSLYLACERGHVETVDVLLSHGADVQLTNGISDPTLHLACRKEHKEVVKLLLARGVDVQLTNSYRQTALHIASSGYIVDLLIRSGADINFECHNGYTPLLTALYANNFEVMDVLLRRGAKVDEPEPFGSTALHIACGQGNLEVVRSLILYGANARLANRDLRTPLHVACSTRSNTTTIVEFLLANGAVEKSINGEQEENKEGTKRGDVDAKNKRGMTALEWACKRDKFEVVAKLIQCGADVQAVPGTHAFREGVALILYENGWKRPYLAARARAGDHKHVAWLLRVGKKVVAERDEVLNGRDDQGMTAVDYVINHGEYELALEMLTLGAQVTNVDDQSVKSHLHLVASLRARSEYKVKVLKQQLARLLIDGGANINAVYADHHGHIFALSTPLHAALSASFVEVVGILVMAGAEYSHYVARDGHKETLTSVWKLCRGNRELLKLLGGSWSPVNHRKHPPCVRDAIVCFLLINRRQQFGLDASLLSKIFDMLAYKWQV